MPGHIKRLDLVTNPLGKWSRAHQASGRVPSHPVGGAKPIQRNSIKRRLPQYSLMHEASAPRFPAVDTPFDKYAQDQDYEKNNQQMGLKPSSLDKPNQKRFTYRVVMKLRIIKSKHYSNSDGLVCSLVLSWRLRSSLRWKTSAGPSTRPSASVPSFEEELLFTKRWLRSCPERVSER